MQLIAWDKTSLIEAIKKMKLNVDILDWNMAMRPGLRSKERSI